MAETTRFGQAANRGAIAAGIERWKTAGGGAAGRAAVEAYLNRVYPDMARNSRDALMSRISEAIALGNRYRSNSNQYTAPRSAFPSSADAQRREGRRGNVTYFYSVAIQYRGRDAAGILQTRWYRMVLAEDRPLSWNDAQAKARERFQQTYQFQRLAYRRGSDLGPNPTIRDFDIMGAWEGL